MDQLICRILKVGVVLFCASAIADEAFSVGPRAFSITQGVYRLSVIPPKFKFETSYRLFEQQRFSELAAFEGEEKASAASVQAKLELKKPKRDAIVWARVLPTTLIPNKAVILEWGIRPIVVFQGSYGGEDPQGPFLIIGPEGKYITNGWMNYTRGTWQITNDVLVFLDPEGATRTHLDLGRTLLK